MSEVLHHTFVQLTVFFACALPPVQTASTNMCSLAVNSAAVGPVVRVGIKRGTARAAIGLIS